MAGYSGTPLAKKLGIREDDSIAFRGAPAGFHNRSTPSPAASRSGARRGAARRNRRLLHPTGELERDLPALARAIFPDGGLWIAWPKRILRRRDRHHRGRRSARSPCRDGLVDNKVCAIDETWSGLRLVLPAREPRRAEARCSGAQADADGVARAEGAISRESLPPCQASGDSPGASLIRRASGSRSPQASATA